MNQDHMETIANTMRTDVSRRTIVKTGVKLAYAAPLVAASFRLSAGAVGAQTVSPGICTFGFFCGDPPNFFICGTDPRGISSQCNCYETDGGTGVACGARICITAGGTCTVSDDCPAGSFCSFNTCCGNGACIPDCGGPGIVGGFDHSDDPIGGRH